MTENGLSKSALLTGLYIFLVILALALLDLGLYWLFTNSVFDGLDWLNEQGLAAKIIFLVVASALCLVLLPFGGLLSVTTGRIVFIRLPENIVTITVSSLLAILNSLICVAMFWNIPRSFDFWLVCEMLVLSLYIISLNGIAWPARRIWVSSPDPLDTDTPRES